MKKLVAVFMLVVVVILLLTSVAQLQSRLELANHQVRSLEYDVAHLEYELNVEMPGENWTDWEKSIYLWDHDGLVDDGVIVLPDDWHYDKTIKIRELDPHPFKVYVRELPGLIFNESIFYSVTGDWRRVAVQPGETIRVSWHEGSNEEWDHSGAIFNTCDTKSTKRCWPVTLRFEHMDVLESAYDQYSE